MVDGELVHTSCIKSNDLPTQTSHTTTHTEYDEQTGLLEIRAYTIESELISTTNIDGEMRSINDIFQR